MNELPKLEKFFMEAMNPELSDKEAEQIILGNAQDVFDEIRQSSELKIKKQIEDRMNEIAALSKLLGKEIEWSFINNE
jgi:hypothetical protein